MPRRIVKIPSVRMSLGISQHDDLLSSLYLP
jgi:hypothetical protein